MPPADPRKTVRSSSTTCSTPRCGNSTRATPRPRVPCSGSSAISTPTCPASRLRSTGSRTRVCRGAPQGYGGQTGFFCESMWTRDPHELLLMEARAAQELFKTADFADRRRKRGTQKENPRKSAVIPPTLRPFDKPFRQARGPRLRQRRDRRRRPRASSPLSPQPRKALEEPDAGAFRGSMRRRKPRLRATAGLAGRAREAGGPSPSQCAPARSAGARAGWNQRRGAGGNGVLSKPRIAPAASSPVRMTNGAGAGAGRLAK